jgi:hypothetical protein
MIGEAAGFGGDDGHHAGEKPECGEEAEAEMRNEATERVPREKQTGDTAEGNARDEVGVTEGAVEARASGAEAIEELEWTEQEGERGGDSVGGDEGAVLIEHSDHLRMNADALGAAAVGPDGVTGDADAKEERRGKRP